MWPMMSPISGLTAVPEHYLHFHSTVHSGDSGSNGFPG